MRTLKNLIAMAGVYLAVALPFIFYSQGSREFAYPERFSKQKIVQALSEEEVRQKALSLDSLLEEDSFFSLPLDSIPRDDLIKAIIAVESTEDPSAVSKKGAVGLMQIMPDGALIDYNSRHKTSYSKEDLYNPLINRKIGEWYFYVRLPEIMVSKRIPVTIGNALRSYNGGAENIRVWLEQGADPEKLSDETKDYPEKVYSKLFG